jgi:hypothetical protein
MQIIGHVVSACFFNRMERGGRQRHAMIVKFLTVCAPPNKKGGGSLISRRRGCLNQRPG